MEPPVEILLRFQRRETNYVRPVRSERGAVQGVDVRQRVVPDILNNFLICVCGSQRPPWRTNKPFPGLSSDEPLSKFDGSNHRFYIKVRGQVVGVDDGGAEWIQVLQFDRSAYPEK